MWHYHIEARKLNRLLVGGTLRSSKLRKSSCDRNSLTFLMEVWKYIKYNYAENIYEYCILQHKYSKQREITTSMYLKQAFSVDFKCCYSFSILYILYHPPPGNILIIYSFRASYDIYSFIYNTQPALYIVPYYIIELSGISKLLKPNYDLYILHLKLLRKVLHLDMQNIEHLWSYAAKPIWFSWLSPFSSPIYTQNSCLLAESENELVLIFLPLEVARFLCLIFPKLWSN